MSSLPYRRPDSASAPVTILRASSEGLTAQADWLAVEEPLEIHLNYERTPGVRVSRSLSVTMRTPGHDTELALGFLHGEGILRDPAGILVTPAPDGAGASANRVEVRLPDGISVELSRLERNFYTTSSCGVCGKASIAALALPPVARRPGQWTVPVATVLALPQRLREAQPAFGETGGLHAAGLFDRAGTLLLAREDVGRHNAVDKLVGARLVSHAGDFDDCILVLSGRASFELMQKAIVAGIALVVAVGAPSSLAVELTRESGTTLIGFVRDGRMNVYAGAHRLDEVTS